MDNIFIETTIEYKEYINSYFNFYDITIKYDDIFLNILKQYSDPQNINKLIFIELIKIAINFELLCILLDKFIKLFDDSDDSLLQLYILDIFSFITSNLNNIIHNEFIIGKIGVNRIFKLIYDLNIETLIDCIDDDSYKIKLSTIIENKKIIIKNEFTEILNILIC